MDTRTGELHHLMPNESVSKAEERLKMQLGQLVEVNRDLSKTEELAMQIKLYSPCACGSGKKFKFCCKK